MDKNEKQKVQMTSHQFLKKNLQFIISFSLLSFVITYTLVIIEYYHYNFHFFSTLLFPLLHQALERKYIFLICNGIVAFLAKNLSFSSSDPIDELAEANEGSELEAIGSQEKNVACVEEQEEEEEEGGGGGGVGGGEGEERDCRALIKGTEDDEDDDEELEERGSSIPPPSAEDEVNMNTEELNRKFDEFIRKMKEEIRIEAQQQLITV